MREVTIRPSNKGIEYKQIQNTILFTLRQPQYLSIEFNGDRLHNLHLFANPLETEKYDKVENPVRGIEVTDSKNILIDGITVVNPDHYTVFGGGSTGITIKT